MYYTAGEVAAKLKITKDTLRYYEKEGLLPPIRRNAAGHRQYTEDNVEWLFLIRCLRDTDMPISKIKQYMMLLVQGGYHSMDERRNILEDHKQYIHTKMQAYHTLLQLIDKKISFYDLALDPNNQDMKCTDYAYEWEHFRSMIGGFKYDE